MTLKTLNPIDLYDLATRWLERKATIAEVDEALGLARMAAKRIQELEAQRDALERGYIRIAQYLPNCAPNLACIEEAIGEVADAAGKAVAELESLREDATRWREATASHSDVSDEALAKLAHDECHPHYPFRWGDVDGPGLAESADFVYVARVVRERVQAQCAARAAADVAEAFDEPNDKPYQETLEIVRQRLASAMAAADGSAHSEPQPTPAVGDTVVSPRSAQPEVEGEVTALFGDRPRCWVRWPGGVGPASFDRLRVVKRAASKPEAPREPRPGEVWRVLGDEECVATDRMSPTGTRFMASLQRPGLDFEWDESCASQWEFVRAPEAAEPTPPAPLPPMPNATQLDWWRSGMIDGHFVGDDDDMSPTLGEVKTMGKVLAALVDCEMARRAGSGGSAGGGK